MCFPNKKIFAGEYMKKTVIIITGPTASGKTSLSLQLAKHFNTSVISADSRQCFRELNIGVAKPTYQQLIAVPHYFINTHSISDKVTAGVFEKYALNAAAQEFEKQDVVVMAGGTGLYIKAFSEGLDEVPDVDDKIRKTIHDDYWENGLAWLQNEVKETDPAFWEQAEQQNPRRLMRALEVITSTGLSILSFRKKENVTRPFSIVKIGIDISRDHLHYNIDERVDEMMEDGLVEEVETLLPHRHLNALQTVGYKELFEYFDHKIPRHIAVENIKQNTRHYAKRQLTWFKKDTSIHWMKSDENVLQFVHQLL